MPITNSVFNKSSRYVHGGKTEVGELGLEWWEKRNLSVDSTDTSFVVDTFHANRLDLIASIFYGEPRWWWVLAQINNILDPMQEVVEGRILFIPTRERLMVLLNGKVGGTNSTRIKNLNIISPVIV